MNETSDINEIVELINRGTYKLICVDGIDGAGKSTLAQHLSGILGINYISLDDFVEKEKGNYVEFLDINQLNKALDLPDRPTIIEGICVLDVLARLGLCCDLLIYTQLSELIQHVDFTKLLYNFSVAI